MTWTCSTCTLDNDDTNEICEACTNPREVYQQQTLNQTNIRFDHVDSEMKPAIESWTRAIHSISVENKVYWDGFYQACAYVLKYRTDPSSKNFVSHLPQGISLFMNSSAIAIYNQQVSETISLVLQYISFLLTENEVFESSCDDKPVS